MAPDHTKATDPVGGPPDRSADDPGLSRTILRCANKGLSRAAFWRETSEVLLDRFGCDSLEIRLSDGDLHYRCRVARRPEPGASFEIVRWPVDGDGAVIPVESDGPDLERICTQVATRRFDASAACFTENGSFWTGDTCEPLLCAPRAGETVSARRLHIGGRHRSLAVIRFEIDPRSVGLLHLESAQPGFFSRDDVMLGERVAQTLGLAAASQQALWSLRERVKELTCLYQIAQMVEHPDTPLPEILRLIVEQLPAAWQYPEAAAARIVLDGVAYATHGFRESRREQCADIAVHGRRRGTVSVVYLQEHPGFSFGVFLPEERRLIDAVARELSLIIERKEAETERDKLRDQLIHADRLATIGELAAGVAHELNEPLSSVLGFAQLVEKSPDLPDGARQDVARIIKASLHARGVIRKLLVFARQTPPTIATVDVNGAVEEGLLFLRGRCAKSDIRINRDLAPELPPVRADPSQLNQVLVNLAVNAIQAMPGGGAITIRTRAEDDAVLLSVADTGVGIDAGILDKIFMPFFSTKDVDEGTGLGLAVVHGIVTSHGGTIEVDSRVGEGACFTVRLPRFDEAEETSGAEHAQGT